MSSGSASWSIAVSDISGSIHGSQSFAPISLGDDDFDGPVLSLRQIAISMNFHSK